MRVRTSKVSNHYRYFEWRYIKAKYHYSGLHLCVLTLYFASLLYEASLFGRSTYKAKLNSKIISQFELVYPSLWFVSY